jgi:hypothetical protein
VPMKPTSQKEIDRIVSLKAKHDRQEKAFEAVRDEFRDAVYEYVENLGGSPTALARALGVTRGRIYQIRDLAAADRGRA